MFDQHKIFSEPLITTHEQPEKQKTEKKSRTQMPKQGNHGRESKNAIAS